jgi:hypothetical protein
MQATRAQQRRSHGLVSWSSMGPSVGELGPGKTEKGSMSRLIITPPLMVLLLLHTVGNPLNTHGIVPLKALLLLDT